MENQRERFEKSLNRLYHPDFPRGLNISFIDNQCNYKCRMCVLSQKDSQKIKPRTMTWETMQRLSETIPNSKDITFDCTPMGEPMLFKDLHKYLKHFRDSHPDNPMAVSTNARHLTEERVRELHDVGITIIHTSQFAGNPSAYKDICGGSADDLEHVRENITRAGEVLRSLNSNTKLWTFIFNIDENEAEKDEFLKTWSKRVDNAYFRKMHNNHGYIKSSEGIVTSARGMDRYPCSTLWAYTSIRADGSVIPCYHSPLDNRFAVGNIMEEELKDIWQGEKMNALRDKHLKGEWDVDLCAECESWSGDIPIFKKTESGFEVGFPGDDVYEQYGSSNSNFC